MGVVEGGVFTRNVWQVQKRFVDALSLKAKSFGYSNWIFNDRRANRFSCLPLIFLSKSKKV